MARKLYIIFTVPLELIGCAIWGGYLGGRDAIRNIREAWAERGRHGD